MYVKIEDGSVAEFPYTIKKLKADNPNVSFPVEIGSAILEEYGVYKVAYLDPDAYNKETQYVSRNALPTFVDGVWVVGCTIKDKTDEEIAAHTSMLETDFRAQRNRLLSETDYLALSDMTLSPEMAQYRQSLRDITSLENWPNLTESDWPVKP